MKIRDCPECRPTTPNRLGPIILRPGCGEWQMLHCDLKTRAPAAASCACEAPASPHNKASTIPSRNECRMGKALTVLRPGFAVRIPVAVRGVDAISGALFRCAENFSVCGRLAPAGVVGRRD